MLNNRMKDSLLHGFWCHSWKFVNLQRCRPDNYNETLVKQRGKNSLCLAIMSTGSVADSKRNT